MCLIVYLTWEKKHGNCKDNVNVVKTGNANLLLPKSINSLAINITILNVFDGVPNLYGNSNWKFPSVEKPDKDFVFWLCFNQSVASTRSSGSYYQSDQMWEYNVAQFFQKLPQK